MTRQQLVTVASAALAAVVAAPAHAQDALNPRGELERVALALDAAVRRVSLPSAEPMLGTEAARGYYVPGVGAVFVVPARSMPRATRVLRVERGPGGALVAPARAPEAVERAELEALLGAEDAGRVLEQRRLEEEARREVARMARERRLQGGERDLHALEDRAEAFRREAERARQEAERMLEEVMREVHVRMGVTLEPGQELELAVVATPSPGASARTATAGQPAPPSAGAVVPGTPADAAAPGTPGPPPTAPLPGLPRIAPPWRFWFATENPEDDRSPDGLVADVRQAVVAALETHGASLRTIPPDELVSVAVDFVPRGLFTAAQRPTRTLVVRVKKRLLEERAAGRVPAEEFARKLQVTEY